ncbi:hypothetical protein [Virgibacillus proomii]|jgi:hypothetical protein|uniref:hypothetical protein n=1 Tax=Virgibacillus proomii TaxID=84407 RepID=UPI0009869F87|nr:hypothetical protein [Virgibacillus proomii]
MTILVVNCNHWIGFHVVNYLLENGMEVEGLLNDKEDESLSLFFGRNSNFIFYSHKRDNRYNLIIQIGQMEVPSAVSSDYSIVLDYKQPEKIRATDLFIELPLLFGEWMPMTEKGMYMNQHFIPFSSTHFLEHAIYIKDFVKSLMDWLETDDDYKKLTVIKKNQLEKILQIRDNKPNKDKLEQVIRHYCLFRNKD